MTITCLHKMIDLDYLPQAGRDTNAMVLTMRVRCRDCGPLRFIGVDEGLSLSRPMTSPDGLVLHLPVVAEFEEVERERMVS